jgi:hypothetical protein
MDKNKIRKLEEQYKIDKVKLLNSTKLSNKDYSTKLLSLFNDFHKTKCELLENKGLITEDEGVGVTGEDTFLYDSFKKIKGSKIIDIGFHPLYTEGGLTIDFIKPDSEEKCRIVIGFNDLGAWVVKELSKL